MRPLAAACLLLVLGCGGTPSKQECDGIVDHLVEIFTAGKMGEEDQHYPKDYPQLVESWRKVLKDDKDATHESLMQICQTRLSSGAASCVMGAKNERELARCFGG